MPSMNRSRIHLGGALGLGVLAVMALRLIAMASARSARTVRAG
jgi:hypothetical protein